MFVGLRPAAALRGDFVRGKWRKAIRIPALFLLAGVFLWGGLHAYRYWKQWRLVHQAEQHLARADYREAVVAARAALVADPSNVEACRVIAHVADRARNRDALWWRARVVTLQPGVDANRLAWAATALSFGDLDAAGAALAGLPEASRHSAAFHSLSASLAVAVRQWSAAEGNLREAIRLEPTNSLHRFNLAAVQLQSPRLPTSVVGRQAMEGFRAQDRFRVPALRALLADASRSGDRARAVALVNDLKSDPSATLADRLACLDALVHMRARDAGPYLDAVRKSVAERPSDAARLISWMNERGMAKQAIAWSSSLSPACASQMPVPVALAESREALHDWDGLILFLDRSTWGEKEYLRCAMLARARREKSDLAASRVQWRLATALAKGRLDAMEMLARLAGVWGWTREREEALWALSATPGCGRWVTQDLYRHYRQLGDADALLRVLALTLERDPSDAAARNNQAMLWLLKGMNTENAMKCSREVWEKNRTNPAAVSTHAFALYTQGQAREAVKLMETLPEAELRRPGLAAYYGLFLAKVGALERARNYLHLAQGAPLLPEEKALLALAIQKAGP